MKKFILPFIGQITMDLIFWFGIYQLFIHGPYEQYAFNGIAFVLFFHCLSIFGCLFGADQMAESLAKNIDKKSFHPIVRNYVKITTLVESLALAVCGHYILAGILAISVILTDSAKTAALEIIEKDENS